QTSAENNLGGIDRSSQVYDFTGNVVRSVMNHVTANESHTIAQRFDYDHKGRLLGNYHSIDENDEILLSDLEYNEMGQLVNKNLHTLNDGTYSQSVDYRYNIRGWLTHINNAALTNDDGITNDEANDYFGFEINYQNPQNASSEALFNGNISEVIWNNFGGNKSTYSYTYDPLNRLSQAVFEDYNNPIHNGKYNALIAGYDNNGNIQGLLRGVNGNIDELSYTYQGNQLFQVADKGGTEGFKDGINTGNDYLYDNNGNMISDENKDIEAIIYNHLNLPSKVIKGDGKHIVYTYDAAGMKLAQEVFDIDNTPTKRTDYNGEFIYETADAETELAIIQHAEGRIVPDAINGGYAYQYHLKDHLGNTRVTFTTKPKTIDILLNYESSNVDTDDEAMFSDLNNIIAADIHDHENENESVNHDKVQVLNGAEGGVIGSVLTIPVGKGDKINASVYAKYMTPKGTANATAAVGKLLMTAISGSTGLGTYEGTVTSNYGGSGSMVTNMHSDELSETEPYAFINLAFLSEDVTATPIISYGQIKEASANGMAQMTLPETFEAPGNGYVIVYLSNESEYLTEVYFDDLEVEVEEHPVIQKDDYFPFGLTFNSYQRVTAKENRFKYNGKEFQKDLDLNQYAYGARFYDPAISRFTTLDPKAETYSNWSPYLYGANNPIRYEDTNGEGPGDRVLGFAASLIDNATGGLTNVRSFAAGYVSEGGAADFNDGQNMGDVASIVVGASLIEGGTGAGTIGVVAAPETGGLSLVVSGVGLAAVAEGSVLVGTGAANLTSQKGRLNTEGESNQGSGQGRGKNNRQPDKEATGDHSVINERGSSTFEKNSNNPNGWQETSHIDTKGAAHTNKQTGQKVDVPHRQGKGLDGKKIPGGVEPVNPAPKYKGPPFN
ncbi:MAG: RHS repeat-associated core domain-containing protein, partial [Fulvivirga sp.]